MRGFTSTAFSFSSSGEGEAGGGEGEGLVAPAESLAGFAGSLLLLSTACFDFLDVEGAGDDEVEDLFMATHSGKSYETMAKTILRRSRDAL